MTPELWTLLIPAVSALLLAAASWLRSRELHSRVSRLELGQGHGHNNGGRVAPQKEE